MKKEKGRADEKCCGGMEKMPIRTNLERKKLYQVWNGMRARTENKNNHAFKDYGARGIKLCEEWKEFENFRIWALQNGYKEGLSIEREDNDGDYCPENCKWADNETQANNKRSSRKIKYNGEIKTVNQWAKQYGINRATLTERLNKGMTIEEAIQKPIKGGEGSGYKPHIDKQKTRETIKKLVDGINDNAELDKIHKIVYEAYKKEAEKKYKL